MRMPMTSVETRHIARDSLFLMAELCLEGSDLRHRVKVRNLSAGGMMAEGDARVAPGSKVSLNLRNIGWVDGCVAWVQDNRFGIAFVDEIDARAVRGMPPAAAVKHDAPRYTGNRAQPGQRRRGPLFKI